MASATAKSANENRVSFERGVEAVFNQKDLSYIETFYTQDVIDHSASPGQPSGIEGVRTKVAAFTTAFPDLRIDYELIVTEGDTVAGRFNLTGTHAGDFGGIAPTGATVDVQGHDMVRMRDGKVAEHWLVIDMLSLMQQLGVVG